MEQLTARYDRLREASGRGDEAEVARAFREVAGIADGPAAFVGEAPGVVQWIRYDRPSRIDRIALRRGARAVAKFEDLDLGTALALEKWLRAEGLRVVRVGSYTRRFDVALTAPGGAANRYLVAASRGREAEAVLEAEGDRSSEGARRVGILLGYPPCCVERFVALERSPEAERDGINEAALRALLDGSPVHWSLHPLCSEALVGFLPCDGQCPRALDFARRVFEAVEHEDPPGALVLRGKLLRPMLVLRVGLFWVFDGTAEGGARDGRVRYTRVFAHDDPALPWLRAAGARAVGAALAQADEVTLDEGALAAWRAGAPMARWGLSRPMVPRWWIPRAEGF
jgi:hypothetical protein